MWVARLMRGLSLRTMETVATETLARRATSRMEILRSSPGCTAPLVVGEAVEATARRWRLFGILVKQFTNELNDVNSGQNYSGRGRSAPPRFPNRGKRFDFSVKPFKVFIGRPGGAAARPEHLSALRSSEERQIMKKLCVALAAFVCLGIA